MCVAYFVKHLSKLIDSVLMLLYSSCLTRILSTMFVNQILLMFLHLRYLLLFLLQLSLNFLDLFIFAVNLFFAFAEKSLDLFHLMLQFLYFLFILALNQRHFFIDYLFTLTYYDTVAHFEIFCMFLHLSFQSHIVF